MLYVLFEQPMLNLMVVFYQISSNLGVLIILLTIFIKTIMVPFMIPTYKNMKKQRELKPEIDKIKQKHKDDKKKLAEAQMELFKQHGINPTSGCLSQVVMIFALIGLYQVVQKVSGIQNLEELNSGIYFEFLKFTAEDTLQKSLWLFNMSEIDLTFILPIFAGVFTLLTSAMMLPELTEAEKAAKKASTEMEDMAYTIQQQMTIIAPVMTFFVCLSLPAALSLYIFVSSVYSVFQQYFMLGNWGGLTQYIKIIKGYLKK
jgi:YidC/Oxa1 family membrane protein insertase